jgi:hypothetical protein
MGGRGGYRRLDSGKENRGIVKKESKTSETRTK